jgi:hypothetical protein
LRLLYRTPSRLTQSWDTSSMAWAGVPYSRVMEAKRSLLAAPGFVHFICWINWIHWINWINWIHWPRGCRRTNKRIRKRASARAARRINRLGIAPIARPIAKSAGCRCIMGRQCGLEAPWSSAHHFSLHYLARFFKVAAVTGRHCRVRMTRTMESARLSPSPPDCTRESARLFVLMFPS